MGRLDFLVIGAQKAGTTTLWHLLRGHPQLELPGGKEVPYFADDRLYARGLDDYVDAFFPGDKPGALRGTVSPQYMFDSASRTVDEVAERIAHDLPDVKLIALLRDPVERAVSHYRMSVRRGNERRTAAEAVRQQLTPAALAAGRVPVGRITPPEAQARTYANSRYVTAGEYGRILSAYTARFPRSQLLVLLTGDLEGNPHGLLARVLTFLGVDAAWRPADVGARRLVGGDESRVAPDEIRRLAELLTAAAPSVPPEALAVALEEWNAVPAAAARLPADLEARLYGHYDADAALLAEQLDVHVPWAGLGDAPHRPGPAPRSAGGHGGAGEVLRNLSAALGAGRGYSLVRLDGWEEMLLRTALGQQTRPNLDAIGVRGDPAAGAEELCRALGDADAIALDADGTSAGESLEQLGLVPPLTCPPRVGYELLGIDPNTGVECGPSPLHELLGRRPLAVVCPRALVQWLETRLQGRARQGLNVCLVVPLDDLAEVDGALLSLAARREAYDAVLTMGGGVPAKRLCGRLARELDVVALDLGQGLNRFLHPRFNEQSAVHARARWAAEEYLRSLREEEDAPPHPLDGRLLRDGDGALFYVERGRARPVPHPALRALFESEPVDVAADELDRIPRGAPIALVHERLTGTYVLVDGRKRPVELGPAVVDLDDFALRDVPDDDRPFSWHPET